MRLKRPLIIQIEFFPPQKSSLSEALSDVAERVRDVGRGKNVVRFFDKNETLYRFLKKRTRHENQAAKASATYAQGALRLLVLARKAWHAYWADRLTRNLFAYAHRNLKKALQRGDEVLIEPCTVRPFRRVADNEKRELLESTARAPAAWVFVFAHDDLYEDSPGKCLITYM